MKDNTREAALEAWWACIELNARADYKVNDLLEKIAGAKYNVYESDDDPIYTIIGNLTASERRRFIKGAKEILSNEQ